MHSILIVYEADADPYTAGWGDIERDRFDSALEFVMSSPRWRSVLAPAHNHSYVVFQRGDRGPEVFEADDHDAADTLSDHFEDNVLGPAGSVH